MMKEFAQKIRNMAGEYPAEFNEHNPRFVASMETKQGTTFRVSCKGDQASILAMADRIEKKKPASLSHPTRQRSHVNLSRTFNEQTFRDLTADDPVGAVQYAENMKRQVVFDYNGNPMLMLKTPDCLYPFPDLVLATDAGRYSVMHLHSGLFIGKPDTQKTKTKAIEGFREQQNKRGDAAIREAIQKNHNPSFQIDCYLALFNEGQ